MDFDTRRHVNPRLPEAPSVAETTDADTWSLSLGLTLEGSSVAMVTATGEPWTTEMEAVVTVERPSDAVVTVNVSASVATGVDDCSWRAEHGDPATTCACVSHATHTAKTRIRQSHEQTNCAVALPGSLATAAMSAGTVVVREPPTMDATRGG